MPAKKDSCLRDVITLADLPTLLVMSERQVQRLVKQGVIPQARNKAGQFLRARFVMGEVIPRYIEHLRNSLVDDPQEMALREAKLRKAEADAERSELELKLFKNQLHTTDTIMFILTNRITASKARLLAIASRIARLLVGQTDQKKIYNLVYGEVEMALRDVSELGQEDFAKQNQEYLKATQASGKSNGLRK